MRDPRCWREVLIRAGTMTIVVAVLYFFLGLDPKVWLVPVAIAALVCIKWTLRPPDHDQGDLLDPDDMG